MAVPGLLRARRLTVSLAVVAYLLPSSVALATAAGHGVGHLGEVAARQRNRAVALGLGHAARSPTHEPASTAPPTIVHTHDGSTHRHEGLLAVLIQASDSTTLEEAPMQAPPTLASHLPSSSSGTPDRPTLSLPGVLGHAAPCGACEGEPRLPPPRV